MTSLSNIFEPFPGEIHGISSVKCLKEKTTIYNDTHNHNHNRKPINSSKRISISNVSITRSSINSISHHYSYIRHNTHSLPKINSKLSTNYSNSLYSNYSNFSNKSTPRATPPRTPYTPLTPLTPLAPATPATPQVLKEWTHISTLTETDHETETETETETDSEFEPFSLRQIEEDFSQTVEDSMLVTEFVAKKHSKYSALAAYGFQFNKVLATTLQGNVLEVFNTRAGMHTNMPLIIKQTNKQLHRRGITIRNGRKLRVQENILVETQIMNLLQTNQPPSAFIGYYGFFEDMDNYYLVMNHGGTDFFDFIVSVHQRISQGKLKLSEWRKHKKHIFAQMVEFVLWMHTEMHCCHLDISLENMLIERCVSFNNGELSNCHIKLIDFGLAQFFDTTENPDFRCRKFVGKQHYKCPLICRKRAFDARAADVWSLGVCLFMMTAGSPPYKNIHDICFTEYVAKQKIVALLKAWGRLHYLTVNLADLISKMLTVDEDKRITMQQVTKHPWISPYFATHNTRNFNQRPEQKQRQKQKVKMKMKQSNLPTILDSSTTVEQETRCFSLEECATATIATTANTNKIKNVKCRRKWKKNKNKNNKKKAKVKAKGSGKTKSKIRNIKSWFV